MATKPIIEVGIDSSAFDDFKKRFDEYTATIEGMPEQWASINTEIGATKDALKGHGEALDAIQDSLLGIIAAQHEVGRVTLTANKGFQGIAKTVKGLAGDIFGIATNVLKMGAAGLGLGIIGSGFGFDALAGSALTQLRGSNSLGLNPGQLDSFKVDMQQFLNVNDLQNAASAQNDISKGGWLQTLGIGYNKAHGEAASDLSIQMLESAVKGWKSNPYAPQVNPAYRAYISLGGHEETVRNAAMDPNFDRDIRAAQNKMHADTPGMNITRADADAMIEFKKQLDAAGMTINNNLIKALAPLSPQLVELSKEFTGLLTAFLKGDGMKVVIGDVRDGLQNLSDFVQGVKWSEVGSDVKVFGDAIHIVASTLGFIINGAKKPGTPAEKAAAAQEQAKWGTVNHAAVADFDKKVGDFGKWFNGPHGSGGIVGDFFMGAMGNVGHAISNLFPRNVPLPGIGYLWEQAGGSKAMAPRMAAIADAESGGNPNARNYNKDGSVDYGLFQINSVHAKELEAAGLKHWKTDPLENAKAAFLVSNHGRNQTPWVTWNEYAGGKDTPAARTIQRDLSSMGNSASITKALQSHARSITRNAATRPIKVSLTAPPGYNIAVSANAAVGSA